MAIAEEKSEIARLYRKNFSQRTLGRKFFSHLNQETSKYRIRDILIDCIEKDEMIKLAHEHRKNNGRNRRADALKSLEARNLVPYTGESRFTEFGNTNEKSYIIYLKLSERYQWEEITEKANHIFQNNRSTHSITNQYHKWLNNLFMPLK